MQISKLGPLARGPSFFIDSKRIRAVALIAVAAVSAGCTRAEPADEPVPVIISSAGGSPYNDCVPDDLSASAVNNSGEVEPTMAVDPRDQERIAVAWQQDRFVDGASRGIVVATTSNRGVSWDTTSDTQLSLCSGGSEANGGAYPRVTDPWLTFGIDGAIHLMGLAVHLDRTASVGANREAVLVTTSRDGGRTWSDPVALVRDDDPSAYNDKPSITAHPGDAQAVYAVWHRLADARVSSVDGDTRFSRSIDGGSTWSRARTILGPIRNGQSFGNEIVVLPDTDGLGGKLVNVFSSISYGRDRRPDQVTVSAMSSDDGGRTWSKPVPISDLDSSPVRLPGRRLELKTGRLLPRVAVDPTSGALYVVWSESSFEAERFSDVALSMSSDGGRSWSDPVKVNQTPEVTDAAARQTFTPEVAVTSEGELAISYFDFRNFDAALPTVATDLFVVRCQDPAPDEDGCSHSWSETRLTPTSFDMTLAPHSAGPFLGDYVGLAGAGATVVATFPQPKYEADPSSIFFKILDPVEPE